MMAKFIVLLLAIAHAVAGLVLLLFSSWFIAACAIAGINFNYMLPAVIIRALALVRIASGYGYMWFGHQQLLDELSGIRLGLFKRLKSGMLKQQAASVEVLAEHTEALANVWIGWVVQNAGAVLMLFLCAGYFMFTFPDASYLGLSFCIMNLILLVHLYFVASKITAKQVSQQQALRKHSEDYLQSVSLWHLYHRPPEVDAHNVWHYQQQLQQKTQHSLVLTQLFGLLLLIWFLIEEANNNLGSATLLVIIIMLISVKDWLTPAATSQLQYARYKQAKRNIEKLHVEPVSLHNVAPPISSIQLIGFTTEYGVNKDINLTIDHSGITLLEGSSGSGKTSLLKALYGLNHFNGQRNVNGLNTAQGILSNGYYAAQQPMILNDTLRANLCLSSGIDDNQDRLKQALILADLSHLTESLNEWIGHSGRRLSGGEAKRLNLARAYLSNSDIWILDEPFEGLAEQQQVFISQQLNTIARDKIIVIASHIFPDNLEIKQSINLDNL